MFGAISTFGGLLALTLPETNKRPLPQTIDDVENWYKKKEQVEPPSSLSSPSSSSSASSSCELVAPHVVIIGNKSNNKNSSSRNNSNNGDSSSNNNNPSKNGNNNADDLQSDNEGVIYSCQELNLDFEGSSQTVDSLGGDDAATFSSQTELVIAMETQGTFM